MDQSRSSRALARNPSINVPRPRFRRPSRTQPINWIARTGRERRARSPSDEPITKPREWLSEDKLKAPWWIIHPEWRPSKPLGPPPPPPVTPPAPARITKITLPANWRNKEEKEDELEDVQKKRGRPREEEKDYDEDNREKKRKVDEGKRKEVPKPLNQPHALPAQQQAILPLSPQDVRAPRVKTPDTDEIRKKVPGPGNFEYRWRNNPEADGDKKIRNSIAAIGELPEVKAMPLQKSEGHRTKKNFKYMGDHSFYSMPVPNDGNCFFGAVSMALYATTKFWHLVKYEHLYFFRYVLTHPAHPRYDFYWNLNSIRGSNNRNMWQQLSIPHAWQTSELFSVTADIYNLFIILYEQQPRPADQTQSQKQQDHQTIGLYGQYNATHVFFHLLNRNHYQALVPHANPEVQFPLPDGAAIDPRPGRVRHKPFGGAGRPILPPPIAQPVIPTPNALDLARVLGYNDAGGALDLDLMTRWIREEREMAERENDPTSLKWWLEGERGGKKKAPLAGPSKAPFKKVAAEAVEIPDSD
ncbi:hypothetical protein DSL72_000525 [Monilinia vaccinii-corymbosi]|uniref:OTU domain-containing protein n=1 Tax=Monilinia vaccinii-corymbosi TaxID=61207 RepID=A0A8A3NZ77_9HELO|nr:hypothetical protein DSL72_000525 [Monilinia vaccinii-corymbosi]